MPRNLGLLFDAQTCLGCDYVKKQNEFINFLIAAKKRTYASLGDDASVEPVFKGSKQLEYKIGKYLYRDIYYGMRFFIGQEVVEFDNKPIWSMVYSGSVMPDIKLERMREIYSFLREAMRLLDHENSYRGPKEFKNEMYIYCNQSEGNIDNFCGIERISFLNGRENVYELRYSGGFVS